MTKGISSKQVVEIFLDFFKQRQHILLPNAPLVPDNDPTLLFINSGMAPLKPYFLGQKTPPHPDLCNIQGCIRTKDIDDVGDRHHLTFFEMLGSWSINHYWKDQAIALAYELLVEGFGFPPDKLYATVYGGNKTLGIPPDEISAREWQKVGLATDHIVVMGEDNFWGPAGIHGPCGPCTEVFFDSGEAYGPQYKPGGHFDDKNRYIEIWNAGVFMEFNKQAEGLLPLSLKSVDTGSGLERMVMALNGHKSVYDTDLLKPLVDFLSDDLGGDAQAIADARMIADHLRASSFILAEGVIPSNTGAGYVPRRLIRKCVALMARRDRQDYDFSDALALIIDSAQSWHSHVNQQSATIIANFNQEKNDFLKVLGRGLHRLNSACAHAPHHLSGQDAFDLFATHGIPIDIIRDFVKEKSGKMDERGFKKAFNQHQILSRGKQAGKGNKSQVYATITAQNQPTVFKGYETLQSLGEIKALIKDGLSVTSVVAGDSVELLCDQTPFYGESGGQVGDTGSMSSASGQFKVETTVKEKGSYHVHQGLVEQGRLCLGDAITLNVCPQHREKVRANHSATHLLQSALRIVLGDHVHQAGSKVEPNRLRFDFHHNGKLSKEELQQIESEVNRNIRANYPTITQKTSYKEAVAQGSLAFADDIYGDVVRMVSFGEASKELCGGTHVNATGDIGVFLIHSEVSVASGVRRIVASTGANAFAQIQQTNQLLGHLAKRLNTGVDGLEQQIESLIKREKATRQVGDNTSTNSKSSAYHNFKDQLQLSLNGTPYLITRIDIDLKQLRNTALEFAANSKGVVCLIHQQGQESVRVIIALDKSQTTKHNAKALLNALLSIIGGKGGGKAHLAEGGGNQIGAIDEMIKRFPDLLG